MWLECSDPRLLCTSGGRLCRTPVCKVVKFARWQARWWRNPILSILSSTVSNDMSSWSHRHITLYLVSLVCVQLFGFSHRLLFSGLLLWYWNLWVLPLFLKMMADISEFTYAKHIFSLAPQKLLSCLSLSNVAWINLHPLDMKTTAQHQCFHSIHARCINSWFHTSCLVIV